MFIKSKYGMVNVNPGQQFIDNGVMMVVLRITTEEQHRVESCWDFSGDVPQVYAVEVGKEEPNHPIWNMLKRMGGKSIFEESNVKSITIGPAKLYKGCWLAGLVHDTPLLNKSNRDYKETLESYTKVFLDVQQNYDLKHEANAREIIRTVQMERKKAKMIPEDRIVLYHYTEDKELLETIGIHRAWIAYDTLSPCWMKLKKDNELKVNGMKMHITVEKL